MHTVNKYLLLNVSKNFFNSLNRHSSHFVYHPEKVLNELGALSDIMVLFLN